MVTINTFKEYETQCVQAFRLPSATHNYVWNNLFGEVGELASLVAKAERDGVTDHQAFWDKYKKELGDALWHITALANDYGWSIQEIAQLNYDKLASRAERGALQGSGDNR